MPWNVTIAIPTFRREDVLIDTIRSCLNQSEPAGEILLLDQTPQHTPQVNRQLRSGMRECDPLGSAGRTIHTEGHEPWG